MNEHAGNYYVLPRWLTNHVLITLSSIQNFMVYVQNQSGPSNGILHRFCLTRVSFLIRMSADSKLNCQQRKNKNREEISKDNC